MTEPLVLEVMGFDSVDSAAFVKVFDEDYGSVLAVSDAVSVEFEDMSVRYWSEYMVDFSSDVVVVYSDNKVVRKRMALRMRTDMMAGACIGNMLRRARSS